MTRAINLRSQPELKLRQFQEFVFIGKPAHNSVLDAIKQLHSFANSNALTQAEVATSLLISQIYTSKDITHQLKDLHIEIGATVKLVNKTSNGSVVVSLNNKLIGIGAEIAHKIVAVRVDQTK